MAKSVTRETLLHTWMREKCTREREVSGVAERYEIRRKFSHMHKRRREKCMHEREEQEKEERKAKKDSEEGLQRFVSPHSERRWRRETVKRGDAMMERLVSPPHMIREESQSEIARSLKTNCLVSKESPNSPIF